VIQQVDVEGAYLNGILKERVHMRQPEGYKDDSGRVCELTFNLKTLYVLKASSDKLMQRWILTSSWNQIPKETEATHSE
jgi:hypothetical protein